MASRLQTRFTELDAFLSANDESARAFGRRAGIDKMTLNRLLNGTMKRFDAGLMRRIHDATNNGVKGAAGSVGADQFAAFLERLSPPKPRKRAA